MFLIIIFIFKTYQTVNKITQVTTDGKKNHIINGASDWVYEEEFALVRSFEWAQKMEIILAYYKFDESQC